MADFIGLLAGALTTIAFVPQLLKIYATKSGKGVSRMFVIFLRRSEVGTAIGLQ